MVFVSIICHKSAICMYNVLFLKVSFHVPSALSPHPGDLGFLPGGVHQGFIPEGCPSSVALPLLVCDGCAFTFTPGHGVSTHSSLDSQLRPPCPRFTHRSDFSLITAINTQKQYNNLLLSSWFSGRKSPQSQSLKFPFSETVVVSTWDHFSLEI